LLGDHDAQERRKTRLPMPGGWITHPREGPRNVRIDLRQAVDALDDNVMGKRMLHLSSGGSVPTAS
jgi:hypothetical protein